jgi:tetratricopeptide (TPR) repeat protein
MIYRSNNYPFRVFPRVKSNIYNYEKKFIKNNLGQQVAQKFINLSDRELNLWERITDCTLDFQGKFVHILFQYRLAFEAEQLGKWQKADFYWRQVQLEFILFTKEENNWNILANTIATSSEDSIKIDPKYLCQQFVDEVLIDTHCAFYNAQTHQVDKLSYDDRGFIHIDYIQNLLDWSGVSGKDIRLLLEDPLITRINLYKESKKWKDAIKVCTQLLRSLPNDIDYQKGLADLHISSTMEKLIDAKSDAQHSKNVATLRNNIKTLEKCLKSYPEHASLFEALGDLYHLQATSLVNSGKIAEALFSVQKAITYNPYLEKAWETRDELVKLMEQLQTQVLQLNAEMSQQSSNKLSAEGKYLQAQARQGFRAMNKYIESKEAKATVFATHIARAIRLWRNIELPEPTKGWQMNVVQGKTPDIDNRAMMIEAAQGWSKLALKLLYCIGDMWRNPPRSPLELQAIWNALVAEEIDLAGLDSQLIFKFLDSKFLGEERDRVLVPPAPPTTPPLLTDISSLKKRSTEPLLPWLFSQQDVRIKIQAVVAIVLILTAGGLISREQKASSARDDAYKNILTANRYQDDLGVVQQAETFFAHAPLSNKDGRKQKVMDLYSESLVRWVAQQGDNLDATTQKHLDRYRTVLNTVTPQEN